MITPQILIDDHIHVEDTICQIIYHQLTGEYRTYSSDKYHNNRDIQPSLLYKELNPDADKEDPQLTIDFGKAPR